MSLVRELPGPPVWRRPVSAASDWMLLALVSPLVLLEKLDLRRLLLAVVLIEIPIQLDMSLSIREDVEAFSGIGGFNISLTTGVLAALYVMWGFDLFRGRAHIDKSRIWASTPMLLYLGAVLLSSLVAYDQKLALYEFNLLFTAMLIGAYIGLNTKTQDDVVFIVALITLGVLMQSLIMIGLRGIGHSLTIATVKMRIDEGVGRVGGTIGSPNGAGSYLAMLIPVCLALASTRVPMVVRIVAGTAAFLGPIALVLTKSRGAWVGLAVGGLVFMCSAVAWNRALVKRLIPLTLIVILAALPFSGEVLTRLQADDNGSAESRMPLMRLATNIAVDHPALGIGPNNFVPIMHKYVTVDFTGVWLRVVHNKYFLVWSETGTIGLIAFLLALGAILRLAFMSARARVPILSPIAAGFGAGLLGHMTHMLVDIFNHRPHITFLWLIAGVLVAIHAVVQRYEYRQSMRLAYSPVAGRDNVAW